MSTEETLFDLPTSPDNFGVVLTPTNLRRIDFSGLDFTTARRAILEYIKTYFPDDFNDFIASNGIIMMTEILASITAKLSLRADLLANEATLPTAVTEEAIINHLALINQRIKRQTPAVIDVEITLAQPVATDILIPAKSTLATYGSNNEQIVYEIYKAPNDWTSAIIVPAGKRGVVAYGIEGQFGNPFTVVSAGGNNQRIIIEEENILEYPIFVTSTVGNTTESWRVVTEPIERFGPNDKVVEVNFFDTRAEFRFGDNITGVAPTSGSSLTIEYRVGGGIRGRIGVGQIDTTLQAKPLPPANATVSLRLRNITPSVGGTEKETLEQAKRRAPRDYALQRSIVTADDYAQAATSFTHPVYGSVSKAIATLRSGLNANLVEIYALTTGADGLATVPNAGLKAGLITYFNDLNVLTDYVDILDGRLKPVDIEMNVIVDRNADASIIRAKVEAAVDQYFSINEWEMGEPFFVSNFIETIERIDGISYIDLFKPTDNIVPTGKITTDENVSGTGIGYNELIIIGTRTINYYYAKTPNPSGKRTG